MAAASTSSPVRPLLRRPVDVLLVVYLVGHVVIGVLFDAQCVVPETWHAAPLRAMVRDYVRTQGDYLVGTLPVWFTTFVWCEMIIQPLFLVPAVYAFVRGCNWIRIPGIIFGSHVATTVIPMVAEFYLSSTFTSEVTRWTTIAIYGAYLVLPIVLVLRLLPEKPFTSKSPRPSSKPAGKSH